MNPGVAGAVVKIVIGNACAALFPQVLLATTETLPEALPKVTVIEVVNCPDVIVLPGGTVQE